MMGRCICLEKITAVGGIQEQRSQTQNLMQNDGTLVVYDTCGVMHWESKTKEKCINIPGKYFFLKK